MAECEAGQAAGLDRAKRWFAGARVTASIAATVVNPLAGPVAHRLDSGPARPTPDATQQLETDAKHDWAKYELLRRERSARDVPARPADTPRQPSRKS